MARSLWDQDDRQSSGRSSESDWYREERAAAQAVVIQLIDYPISAKRDLSASQVEELLDICQRPRFRFSSIVGVARIDRESFRPSMLPALQAGRNSMPSSS